MYAEDEADGETALADDDTALTVEDCVTLTPEPTPRTWRRSLAEACEAPAWPSSTSLGNTKLTLLRRSK